MQPYNYHNGTEKALNHFWVFHVENVSLFRSFPEMVWSIINLLFAFFKHIVVILHAFTYAFEKETFNCITLDSSRFHERKIVEKNVNQYKIQHIKDFSWNYFLWRLMPKLIFVSLTRHVLSAFFYMVLMTDKLFSYINKWWEYRNMLF